MLYPKETTELRNRAYPETPASQINSVHISTGSKSIIK
jgi:hypothetical protein